MLTEKTGLEAFSVFGVVSKSKVFAGESNMSIFLVLFKLAEEDTKFRPLMEHGSVCAWLEFILLSCGYIF